MSQADMSMKVANLREPMRMAEELNAEIEAAKDEIKAEMSHREVEEIHGTDWKVPWKLVKSHRFDSRMLKVSNPELYDRYTTESASRCLVIA